MSTRDRGFASMTPARQREIASKGGRSAHAKGVAHQWTAEEAKAAGRKGGLASRGGRGRAKPATSLDGSILPASQTDVGADVPGGGAS